MKQPHKFQRNAGFSLIELLIVLALLALVVGLAAPKLLKQSEGGKVRAAEIQVKALSNSLDIMHLDINRFPETDEGLELLLDGGDTEDWNGPYLKENTIPKDPWNKPYIYELLEGDDMPYALYSEGAPKSGKKIGKFPE